MQSDRKRATYQGLVDRILDGSGEASSEQRAQAFAGTGLPPPLDELVGRVTTRPAEADLAAATDAGLSEDEVFELVVCAAVGQSTRLYDAGLAALAEATADGRPGRAT